MIRATPLRIPTPKEIGLKLVFDLDNIKDHNPTSNTNSRANRIEPRGPSPERIISARVFTLILQVSKASSLDRRWSNLKHQKPVYFLTLFKDL